MKYLIAAVTAYLLGSFCASIPLSEHVYGEDVRSHGSGNAGATNVARVYGIKAGVITLALDMLKTAIAICIGWYIAGYTGVALCGAFCIIGHCFPLYFGFKGGKGVSVGAALALAAGLKVFCTVMAVFLLAVILSRKVSLGSILAAVTLPAASALFGICTPLIVMNVFSALLVVVMHRENIKRLINGTEPDFKPPKS